MMERVIRSASDLQALANRRTRRAISRVVLDLPQNDIFVRECEREINRNLHACGCDMGALFVVAGLLLSIARFALATPRPSIPGTIALLFTCALVGKVAGIVLAEIRLRAAIKRLASR